VEPIDTVLSETSDNKYRNQIINFFEQFSKINFFDLEQRFAGSILNIVPPQNYLAGPLTVHLEVMDLCNLKCKHCFAGKRLKHDPPLNLRELERLFASMANMGAFRLGLTGGEPLLRLDLFEIIDLAIGYGLSPCLTTNGLLITEDIAKEFGKRKLAWLNVSMEGATSETHDNIRGKGTYARLLQRLSILSQHTKFSLAFTLMRANLHEAHAFTELAYQVGAQAAVFRPLYPIGTALDYPELMPSFEEYIDILESLSETTNSKLFEFCSVHPWGPKTRENSQSIIYEAFGCGAGNTVSSVSVSGDVSPCSFLGPKYIAGNLRERTFEQIWDSSSVFEKMRTIPGDEKCMNCSLYNTCSGGCRARALAINGSISAADPWCASKFEPENNYAFRD
jgi:radical SAM protein with 4Fe4S-binding SPASM domain